VVGINHNWRCARFLIAGCHPTRTRAMPRSKSGAKPGGKVIADKETAAPWVAQGGERRSGVGTTAADAVRTRLHPTDVAGANSHHKGSPDVAFPRLAQLLGDRALHRLERRVGMVALPA
jgi:hypothetical protein